MKTILNLSKIYFKEAFIGLFGTKAKRSVRKSIAIIVFLFALVMAAMGYEFYVITEQLSLFGYAQNILFVGLILSLVMSLMVTISDTQGYLYKTKDYEMLAAMPIKFSHIVIAKYFSSYLVTALYSSLICIPAFVVYFIYQPITAGGIIFSILSLIFIPTFGQLINSLISWLINIVSAKMNNKTLFRTIISLVFVLAFTIFIYLANSDMLSIAFGKEFPLWFKIVFAHINFLFEAIVHQNILYFLATLGISLVFMCLGIGVVMLGYKKINSELITTKTKTKAKNKPLKFESHSPFSGLLKKEASTFFNSPVYCVNGLMGPIMSVVIMLICFSIFNQFASDPVAMEIVKDIFIGMEVFCSTMCLGIAPTTSVSISMEGTKFDNLKTLPLSFKQIAFSKMLFNVLLALPVTIISTIIFVILIKLDVLCAILMILYQIFAIFSQTIFGLLTNLKFPKLNWSNESQAVKQSASMLITMLVDLAISIIPMVLFMVCVSEIEAFSSVIFMAIATAVELVIFVVLAIILKTKGQKMFDRI